MAGAVLCVVGVVCVVDAEPFEVPGAVLCVVGVGCGVAAEWTLDAVSCGAGAEVGGGWDVVSIE